MNLELDIGLASHYRSKSQISRLLTESWALKNVPCPGCGGDLEKYTNNSPVADFFCAICSEDFELKATSGRFGKSIPDGAYKTMTERLSSRTNPNLLIMQYTTDSWCVNNLIAIPKYYFSLSIIQKREPLSATARRAGWVGCNIIFKDIPSSGKISIVSERVVQPLDHVLYSWKKNRFLAETKNDESKGWLLKTMNCIDRIGKCRFELRDIYYYESSLRETYPNNEHIKAKLRQQLQILRDKGYLKFLGKGFYELT